MIVSVPSALMLGAGRICGRSRRHAGGLWRFSPTADPQTHRPYTIAKDGFHGTMYEDPNHAFSVNDLSAREQQHGRVPPKSFVRALQAQSLPGLGARNHQGPI